MSGVIHEPARDIPVVEESDVCVIGGSCTGVFAAVAAARMGMRVALVEMNGFFGGTATAGLVTIWHSRYDTLGRREIIGGLTMRVVERLERRNAVIRAEKANPTRGFVLNTEELKIELDEIVTAAGIRPFLHARFVAPAIEDERLAGVVIEDKTGRRAIRARYFVDASGDGDLVARMGLPTTLGDDLQPPTVCATFSGLPAAKEKYPDFSLSRVVFDPKYPEALRPGTLWHSEVPGLPDLRMVAGTRVHGANCADADELTAAEIEGRRQARSMLDLLRRHFPHDAGYGLAALSSCIGIRETRKAACLHRLTEEEVLTGVRFPDAIANGSYRVDIHHAVTGGITFRYLDGTELITTPRARDVNRRWRPELPEDPTFYQIPYRCLVPRGAVNVLIAGRCIDTDRGAHGATRVMVNTNQMGEAAAAAAALAAQSGLPVASVPPHKLRDALRQHGAIII